MGMRDEQESLDLIARQGNGIHAEQLTITATGTAEQFAAFTVNRPFSIVFKAFAANTGLIFIGNTKAEAESGTARWQLNPNEATSYKLANFNNVWIDAAVSGEKIQATVETSTTLGN